MKLDVEGAELEVLDGMRGLLARGETSVVIEVNDDPTADAVRRFLDQFGYRVRSLGRSAHRAHLVAEPGAA